MQKIFVDIKEFRSIRQDGGLYVDKTKYIYDIIQQGTYFFLARPRRFGKSLLCSTLAELFENNRELFKGLWIDNSSWQWKKHPVIRLDMSEAASKNGTLETVRKGIVNILLANAKKLGVSDLEIDAPHLMLARLIQKAKEAHNNTNVVVIIDEYDKPLLDVIEDPVRFSEIQNELSDFYSQLKPREQDVRFVFITGVFKFTKTSIFSGLNNLNDISFDMQAAELLGYTEQEVRKYFAEHLHVLAIKRGESVDALMFALRDKYNGYTFGIETGTDRLSAGVYNPFGLNYVFKDQQLLNNWFASGTPSALIKTLEKEGFKTLETEALTLNFNTLKNSCTPQAITALTMLYYAGYVTLKSCATDRSGNTSETMIKVGFPNIDVEVDFSQALLPALLEKSFDAVSQLIQKIKKVFNDVRLDGLQNVLNDALASCSYLVLARPYDPVPQENLYQLVFHYLFFASNLRTTMEETTNRGRIDIVVETVRAVFLLEIKMNEPASKALQQIKDMDYAAKYRHQKQEIYAVGICLSSKERCVTELLWKQL